jgi:hypothetical protein
MASFSTFKTLESTLIHFNIQENSQNLFPNIENNIIVPELLVEELEFNMTQMPYKVSEASICEMVIFPILRSVWKNFKEKLLLWSHKSIGKETENTGIPDYIIAKRSHLGRVMDLPLLVMIEAKKDNFDEGWGQCVVQMHTAQILNNNDMPIYGIVSNGDDWQFAQLAGNVFTQHATNISVGELAKLYNILHHLLKVCQERLN